MAAGGGAEASMSEAGELNGVENVNGELNEGAQGYYSDGAYVGLPVTDNGSDVDDPLESNEKDILEDDDGGADSSVKKVTVAPETAYYNRLKALFVAQRRALHSTPSASAVRALSPTQLISLPPNHRRARGEWVRLMQLQRPSPVQLTAMDTDTVLQLLRLVIAMLKRRRNIDERFSAWIWGLLGRLDDVGTLSSEEVCVVRELGKRVIWVMRGFEKMDGMEEPENDVEIDDAVDEVEEEECEQKEQNGNVSGAEDISEGEIDESSDKKSEKTAEITENLRRRRQVINSLQDRSVESSLPKDVIATELDYTDTKYLIKENRKGNHFDQNSDTVIQQLSSAPNSNKPLQHITQPSIKDESSPLDHEPPGLFPATPSRHRRNTSSPPSSPSNDLETAKARLLQNINISQDTPHIEDHRSPVPPESTLTSASALDAEVPIKSNGGKSPINTVTNTTSSSSTAATKPKTCENHYQENEVDEAKRQGNNVSAAVTVAANSSSIPAPIAPAPAEVPVTIPDMNTRATLAMILTVAGEFYGQRDLLEERERWA